MWGPKKGGMVSLKHRVQNDIKRKVYWRLQSTRKEEKTPNLEQCIVGTGANPLSLRNGAYQLADSQRSPSSFILTWQGRHLDQEGGSPRARLSHCTSAVLTPANSPNVGISTA